MPKPTPMGVNSHRTRNPKRFGIFSTSVRCVGPKRVSNTPSVRSNDESDAVYKVASSCGRRVRPEQSEQPFHRESGGSVLHGIEETGLLVMRVAFKRADTICSYCSSFNL